MGQIQITTAYENNFDHTHADGFAGSILSADVRPLRFAHWPL